MKRFILVMVVWFFCATASGLAADNLKAFPSAEAGMVRHVLQLPPQTDESALMVELIIGKLVQLDEQNKYFFGGQIAVETLAGWGFIRYLISSLGPLAGTLMSVDAEAPKVERFITLGGDPYIIRYNSRIPVVVYVPEGVEVRYRLWTGGVEIKAVEKG